MEACAQWIHPFSLASLALQVSGPHHVSAMEAFPAAAGVADRSAGPDGAAAPKAQPGYGSTPVPSPAFSPMNMAGPGKRRLPWAGEHETSALLAYDAQLTSSMYSIQYTTPPCLVEIVV